MLVKFTILLFSQNVKNVIHKNVIQCHLIPSSNSLDIASDDLSTGDKLGGAGKSIVD